MTLQKIAVDRGRCTGIGICESILPDRFELDDDGTLIVHDPLVGDDALAGVEEAVRGCPAAALGLSEADG